MDSMKILAETNMKISEARNTLTSLQQDETKYLTIREEKALDRIKALFDKSSDIIEKTRSNYQEVRQILSWAGELVTFIVEASTNFKKLMDDFAERNALWNEQVGKQEEKFQALERQMKIDTVRLENDKKALESEKKEIANAKLKIESDREEIKRTIIRLKENRI